MASFLEGLTATHDASFFHDEARRLGNPLRTGERGSPLNKGEELRSVHPVIRTNRELIRTLSSACRYKLTEVGIFSCDGLEISIC